MRTVAPSTVSPAPTSFTRTRVMVEIMVTKPASGYDVSPTMKVGRIFSTLSLPEGVSIETIKAQ